MTHKWMNKCPVCGQETKEDIIDPKRTPEAIEAHIGLHEKIAALERENAKLKESLKTALESHDQTVKDLMVEYTKVIDGLRKRLEPIAVVSAQWERDKVIAQESGVSVWRVFPKTLFPIAVNKCMELVGE